MLELVVQVPHVDVGDMTRRPVKVADVPLTELGQHSMLKKPMVPWPIHALIAENSQAEGTAACHKTISASAGKLESPQQISPACPLPPDC